MSGLDFGWSLRIERSIKIFYLGKVRSRTKIGMLISAPNRANDLIVIPLPGIVQFRYLSFKEINEISKEGAFYVAQPRV